MESWSQRSVPGIVRWENVEQEAILLTSPSGFPSEHSPFGLTGHSLLKWPGCPKYRQTLLEKFIWLSEWVSLAWSSCMGSSTSADRLGVGISSSRLTVGPLKTAGKVRGRKLRLGPLPLSLPEMVDEVRCESDQSLEVRCLVSSC